MAKFVMTKKRRAALAKARRKWKKMSHKARAKTMPNRKHSRR